jgi:hypothetical protein
MDPGTFFGILISFVALFLSYFAPAGWKKRLLRVVFGIALLEFALLPVSMPLGVRVAIGLVLLDGGATWVVVVSRREPQPMRRISNTPSRSALYSTA